MVRTGGCAVDLGEGCFFAEKDFVGRTLRSPSRLHPKPESQCEEFRKNETPRGRVIGLGFAQVQCAESYRRSVSERSSFESWRVHAFKECRGTCHD